MALKNRLPCTDAIAENNNSNSNNIKNGNEPKTEQNQNKSDWKKKGKKSSYKMEFIKKM